MTNIHWLNPVSDSFTNPSDWSGGIVPGASDAAILDAAGISPYTVTTSTSETVSSLQTAANATLAVTSGPFMVTGGVVNAGTISVTGGYFSMAGMIDNTGTIGGSFFFIGGSNATLTGGGQIALFGGMYGATSTATLTNVDNTISGAGLIEARLINGAAGVIDATDIQVFQIDSTTIVNDGLIEATGSGPVDFNSNVIDGSGGGVISAGNGSLVRFNYSTVRGGTITSEGTGYIYAYGVTLDGTASPVHLETTMHAPAAGFVGAIVNSGMITDTGDLRIAGNATLSGGGQITLAEDGRGSLYGLFSPQLINVDNTISGAGEIGTRGSDIDRQLVVTIVNESKGVIDATEATNPLVFYTASGSLGQGTAVNAGLIEATGAAGITINLDTIDGSGGGTILAANRSAVRLQTAVIIGGFLKTAGTGVFQVVDTGSLLDGTTSNVNNQGVVDLLSNTKLTVEGGIDNSDAINLARGGGAQLVVGPAGATLSGGGSVSLGDTSKNSIAEAIAGATLTNIDNTISGGGLLGAGSMGLVNGAAGVIDANGANRLVLDTGANMVVNAGLIEATGVGGLFIHGGIVDGSTGGAILAGNASRVILQGATVVGGTLKSVGSGLIETFRGSTDTLDGTASAVNNQAVLVVADDSALTMQGTLDNTGRIGLRGQGVGATLTIGAAGATLTGGGLLRLDNSTLNTITGASSAAVLTNVDNNVSGAGRIGAGSLTLVNEAKGVIVGSQAATLTLDTGPNTIVNAGIILARGAGGVMIESAVANSGFLASDGGMLTVNGAVSGTGKTLIYAGTVDFTSGFSQNVIFQKTTGVLELAQSQNYAGTVSGFSKTGGTSLDLRDIGFVGTAEATYSGTATSGVLTVTDGAHTAHIKLQGDYLGSIFTASSDGHGGTIVIDPPRGGASLVGQAPPHQFIAAMAGLGGSGWVAIHSSAAWSQRALMLVKPHAMIA